MALNSVDLLGFFTYTALAARASTGPTFKGLSFNVGGLSLVRRSLVLCSIRVSVSVAAQCKEYRPMAYTNNLRTLMSRVKAI